MTKILKTIDKINVCIDYIKRFFEETNGKVAVIGISGGKDSTVAAALCVQALGKENVIGVMMPLGTQNDISDSYKLCEFLNIDYLDINIHNACYAIESEIDYLVRVKSKPATNKFNQVSKRAEINLQPRIRMATLYAIAQSMNGRVINTTNACERFVGYGTLFGDTAGDIALFKDLGVSEIYEIGDALGLPHDLVHKTPADGLTGKSDEEVLGVTYADIEKYWKAYNYSNKYHDEGQAYYNMQNLMDKDIFEKIKALHLNSEFKRQIINIPGPEFN